MDNFLKVKGEDFVDRYNQRIILKGINLGGWLMMEGYILGGRNIPEHEFKNNFLKKLGHTALEEFEKLFYHNFIREEDFKNIKYLGFNSVRIPFNYRIINGDKFKYLKEAVRFCKKYNLLAILDMHGAPGSQNQDWHSDSSGTAQLWKNKVYQNEFISLWEKLSFVFKDEEAVAGYDILNEPVAEDTDAVLKVYKEAVKHIRKIDKNHIIFLEGNRWAQDIEFLDKPWEGNLAYSIHFYAPLEFTFGFVPNLKYPDFIFGKFWSKKTLKVLLRRYLEIKREYKVPIWVGEFGQNSRCPFCHKELKWTQDLLAVFEEYGFSWCWWTYKAVASKIFPDGLYQYQHNPIWVNRSANIFGWETYYELWKKYKRQIALSWRTEDYKENKFLMDILRVYLIG